MCNKHTRYLKIKIDFLNSPQRKLNMQLWGHQGALGPPGGLGSSPIAGVRNYFKQWAS